MAYDTVGASDVVEPIGKRESVGLSVAASNATVSAALMPSLSRVNDGATQ